MEYPTMKHSHANNMASINSRTYQIHQFDQPSSLHHIRPYAYLLKRVYFNTGPMRWAPLAFIIVFVLFIIFLRYFPCRESRLRGRLLRDIESGLWGDRGGDIDLSEVAKARWFRHVKKGGFPTFAYGTSKDSKWGRECYICLEEYNQGEECRTLFPACKHTFHADCIDPWLSYNNHCPVCRAVLFV